MSIHTFTAPCSQLRIERIAAHIRANEGQTAKQISESLDLDYRLTLRCLVHMGSAGLVHKLAPAKSGKSAATWAACATPVAAPIAAPRPGLQAFFDIDQRLIKAPQIGAQRDPLIAALFGASRAVNAQEARA